MKGRPLIIGFLIFLALFAAGLIYTQFFAYYVRQPGLTALAAEGGAIPVTDYDGIDSTSSPLKLRGCLRVDPALLAGLPRAPDAEPLTPPFWFRCFDTGALTADIASGAATAYALGRDDPAGFDRMLAVYPDGRGYLWRQLSEEFRD